MVGLPQRNMRKSLGSLIRRRLVMGKLIRNGIDYSTPIVDSRLDTTSTNPVQNKVIKQVLENKIKAKAFNLCPFIYSLIVLIFK